MPTRMIGAGTDATADVDDPVVEALTFSTSTGAAGVDVAGRTGAVRQLPTIAAKTAKAANREIPLRLPKPGWVLKRHHPQEINDTRPHRREGSQLLQERLGPSL